MHRISASLAVAASMILAAPAALADDDDVELTEVPQAARTTIERETKGGTISEIEKDDDDGQIRFEVEFRKDGQRWELHVGQDGKVLHREKD